MRIKQNIKLLLNDFQFPHVFSFLYHYVLMAQAWAENSRLLINILKNVLVVGGRFFRSLLLVLLEPEFEGTIFPRNIFIYSSVNTT